MIRKSIGYSLSAKCILCFLLVITMLVSFSACIETGNTSLQDSTPAQIDMPTEDIRNQETDTPSQDSNIFVAYFSATGTTEGIAEQIATESGGVLYEIMPAHPYTSADLSYNNDDCRANKEQNDPDARPALSGKVENIDGYDMLFLGYPIWWGGLPKLIYTFLENYELDGKIIVPFCTSGDSSIDKECP